MEKVFFTDEARDFIIEKNLDAVTIDLVTLCGCTNKDVFASPGKPQTPEKYALIDTGLFKVYIYKGAEASDDGIEISLEEDNNFINAKMKLAISGLVY